MSDDTERKYRTRYGIMAADKAALVLLDRSAERLSFLQEAFELVHCDGKGFTMPGYMTLGLAAILEDIKHDVLEAHNYYFGDIFEPGKTGDVPERVS